MPIVSITYGDQIPVDALQRFARAVPQLVARVLTCPEGELKPEEVEVRLRPSGKIDVNALDLSLEIVATDYPSRKENLEARKEQLAHKVEDCLLSFGLTSLTVGIWTVLVPSAWSQFKLPDAGPDEE